MTELEKALLASVERLEKESRERETLLLEALNTSKKRMNELAEAFEIMSSHQKEIMKTYNVVLDLLEGYNKKSSATTRRI